MGSLEKILVLIVVCQCCVNSYAQVSKRFFRPDYTYFDSTESFYKIHTIHKTWQEAKKVCVSEGASLFYPEDGNEAEVVKQFLQQTQPFNWVFVGASAIMTKGVYETLEGVPVQNIYHKWAPGEPNDGSAQDCVVLQRDGTLNDQDCASKYPFVCKKSLSTLQWNELCSMPNTDYEYNKDLDRCYKFHLNPLNWTDAYAVCSAEQSYLAVIDSQAEADYLVALTAKAPRETVQGDYLRGIIHVGFHNRTDEGWINIKGVPLVDSGYSKWAYMEPNGEGRELCGSMYYAGSLNDIGCHVRSFFVCEHDVDRTFDFDERLSNDANEINENTVL